MASLTVDLPNLGAMEAFGARIAANLRAGDVVALEGTLGMGKTTLARAILRAAGHQGEVPSPTFTLIESYDHTTPPIIHADFYRLEDPAEATELGIDEYREGAALIAEWPQRAGGFSQEPKCLSITLESVGQGRKAIVELGADWLERAP